LKAAYRVFTPAAVFLGTGSKPKNKSEFVSILEPEINRQISSLVLDVLQEIWRMA